MPGRHVPTAVSKRDGRDKTSASKNERLQGILPLGWASGHRCKPSEPSRNSSGSNLGGTSYTSAMIRSAIATSSLVAGCGALLLACAPVAPPPMDTAALPSASTSAEPLYITTETQPTPPGSSSGRSESPPVEPALPSSVSLESSRTATCPQKHCWRSWMVPRPGRTDIEPNLAHPDLGVALPVAVWQEKLNANVKLDFPRAKGIGLLGLVLQGVVTAAASEGGSLAALKPWSAIVAPGAGLSITADAGGGAVLLVAYPLEGKLDDRIAALRKSDKAVYWEKRPGSFVVEDLERQERLSWAAGGAHAWPGFEADRSPQAYLGLLMLGSDIPVADHDHQDTWEVLVPLRAKGSLVLSGEGAPSKDGFPREVPIRAGEVVTMPPGVHHAFKPGGSEALFAVQLFLPPGPEQRYRKLAQDGVPPR